LRFSPFEATDGVSLTKKVRVVVARHLILFPEPLAVKKVGFAGGRFIAAMTLNLSSK